MNERQSNHMENTGESHRVDRGIYVPEEVLYNHQLHLSDMMLFGLISGLSNNEKGYASVSNGYLGCVLRGMGKSTISSMISKLQRLGYIRLEFKKKNCKGNLITTRKIFVDPSYEEKYRGIALETMGECIDEENKLNRKTSEIQLGNNDDSLSSVSSSENPYTTQSALPPLCQLSRNTDNTPRIASQSSIDMNTRHIIIEDKRKETKEKNFKEALSVRSSDNQINHSPAMVKRSSFPAKESDDAAIQEIVQFYHSDAPSLPKMIKLTDARKKSIRARLKEFDSTEIRGAFQRAEESEFLSGREGSWKGCNIDWLMNPNNLVKVLEGKYDNPGRRENPKSSEPAQTVDELIEKAFPEKLLSQNFKKTIYAPAKKLLTNLKSGDDIRLTQHLLTMEQEISSSQRKNLSPELRLLISGSFNLLHGYIEFLRDSHWVTNIQLSAFTISSTLFSRFRREQAMEDNFERDALTGNSYMRD